MDLGLRGRTALVTAGSRGLGRASALALAAEGCRVAITGRGADALSAAAADLRAVAGSPDDVHTIAGDVTDPAAPAELVAATVERFGGLDILVANAGGPPPMRALEVTEEAVAAAVNANCTTSIRLVEAAVPHLRARGWGRICLITSYSIKQPLPALALSNLARTGLWAWAKTAAADLAADGITLNTAAPGSHATDRMKELGGDPDTMGDPADFGAVVAFLCSQQAGFVNGVALNVDGGAVLGL